MIDTRTITIVNPASEDVVEPQDLVPRLRSLTGAKIGLIDNSKRMANAFLDDVRELLRERYGVADFAAYQKVSASVPTPPGELDRLAEGCDAVIHGVAD